MSKELETARELVKMLEAKEKIELSTCEPGQIIEANGNS